MTVAASATEKPTSNDTREPCTNWLQMSWPRWFVPSGCPGEPGARRASSPPEKGGWIWRKPAKTAARMTSTR